MSQLRMQGWLRGADDPMETLYRTRLFYADSVAEFEAFCRRQDLVLGYRLHGNLLSLANRIPSVYFTYDSRTTEFAETFQIPSFNVFGGKAFRLEDYWDQSPVRAFQTAPTTSVTATCGCSLMKTAFRTRWLTRLRPPPDLPRYRKPAWRPKAWGA